MIAKLLWSIVQVIRLFSITNLESKDLQQWSVIVLS